MPKGPYPLKYLQVKSYNIWDLLLDNPVRENRSGWEDNETILGINWQLLKLNNG